MFKTLFKKSTKELDAATINKSIKLAATITSTINDNLSELINQDDEIIKSDGMDPQLNVIVFLGSTRDERLGIRPAKYIIELLNERKHSVTFFDALELNFPMLKQPYHFYSNPENNAPDWLKAKRQIVKDADAYIVVTAEYNSSMPPGLTNMLDHFPPNDYQCKPCGIVSYSVGPFGGIRAAASIRAMLSDLGMVSVPEAMYCPMVAESFDTNGIPISDRIIKNGKKLVSNLEWYGCALKQHLKVNGMPK